MHFSSFASGTVRYSSFGFVHDQHIGLTAGDVSATVEEMAGRGAQFRRPPPSYYKLVRTNTICFFTDEDEVPTM